MRTPPPSQGRPVLRLPYSRQETAFEVVAALGLLATVAVLVLYGNGAAQSLPRQQSLAGGADAWAGKGFLVFPLAVSILLQALLTAVSFFPHAYNYPRPVTPDNARRLYQAGRTLILRLKAEIALLFLYGEYTEATGADATLLPVFFVLVLATLLVSVVALVKGE